MDKLTLRPARPEDAESICHTYRTSIFCLCADHYSIDQLMAWAGYFEPNAIRLAISHEDSRVFVVEKKGGIVGFSILYGDMLRALYIDPRTVRKGVATMLLRATEEEAIRRGIRRIHLRASINSRPFYEGNGYRVYKEEDFPLNGAPAMLCYAMEKEL